MGDDQHNLEEVYNLVKEYVDQNSKTKRIRISTRTGILFFDPDDIIFIQADWNYSEIYTGKGKKETVSINLGKFQELLSSQVFLRINRSVVINSNYVVKYNKTTKICTLSKDGEDLEFPVSNDCFKNK